MKLFAVASIVAMALSSAASPYDSQRVRQTIIPPSRVQSDYIRDMKVGQHGWVEPWRMTVDQYRHGWLGGLDVYQASYMGGSVDMLIRRERDGYHVFLTKKDEYVWGITPGHGSEDVPVAAFTNTN